MLYSHLCVILLLYRYNSDYFQDLVQHNFITIIVIQIVIIVLSNLKSYMYVRTIDFRKVSPTETFGCTST